MGRSALFGLLACLGATLPGFVQASCLESSAKRYDIDPALLQAIAWVESREHADAVGPVLADDNRALGLMQINTIHLPELEPLGIARPHLMNACVSQEVGAWVLARCIGKFGKTWKAVGCYNTGAGSKNVRAQLRYVGQVMTRYHALRTASLPKLAQSSVFYER